MLRHGPLNNSKVFFSQQARKTYWFVMIRESMAPPPHQPLFEQSYPAENWAVPRMPCLDLRDAPSASQLLLSCATHVSNITLPRGPQVLSATCPGPCSVSLLWEAGEALLSHNRVKFLGPET